jgi:hypothetical protein
MVSAACRLLSTGRPGVPARSFDDRLFDDALVSEFPTVVHHANFN